MKKLLTKFLQKNVDYIIRKASAAKTNNEFKVWFDRGMWLNDFAIHGFNIYLN